MATQRHLTRLAGWDHTVAGHCSHICMVNIDTWLWLLLSKMLRDEQLKRMTTTARTATEQINHKYSKRAVHWLQLFGKVIE